MKNFSPLLIMLAAILWSMDGLLRRSLRPIPPATLVMLEHLAGVVLLLPFLPKFTKEYRTLTIKDWGIVALTALVGGVMGTIFYTAALAQVNYIQYSVVVLLQKTQPLFAIALATIVLKERLNIRYLALAVVGLTAAYLLSFPDYVPDLRNGKGNLAAAALAMGAAISWGSATVLGKLVLHRLSFAAATAARFAIVVPLAYLAAWMLGQTCPLTGITGQQWLTIAGIALSSGTVAYLIYYKGLEHTPAKIATFAELTWPVSAVFIGYFWLKETLSPSQMTGAVVLLTVIFILSLSKTAQNNNHQGRQIS